MKQPALARHSSLRRRRSAQKALAGTIASLLAIQGLSAATLKWDANGAPQPVLDGPGEWTSSSGTFNWNNVDSGGNTFWNNSVTNDAIFGHGGPVGGTISLIDSISVRNITFATTGPTYSIVSVGAVTLALNSSTVTTHVDATIAAPIEGNGFTKAGSARLFLQAGGFGTTNTYQGPVTVSGGTLQIGRGGEQFRIGAIARLAEDEIIFSDALVGVGGTFDLNGFSETVGGISGSGAITSAAAGSVLTLSQNVGAAQIFSGSLKGLLGLTIDAPSGTASAGQTLSGVNSHTGRTVINGNQGAASSLTLANRRAAYLSTVETSAADSLKFSQNVGTFTLGGLASSGSFAIAHTAGGAVTLEVGNNNRDTSYTGLLSGAGALTKIGSGTLTLSGADPHTYQGPTRVNGGTLRLDVAGLLVPSNGINSASSLELGGGVLNIVGHASSATTQTFGGPAFAVTAGGSGIQLTPTNSQNLTLTLPNQWVRTAGATLSIDLSNTGELVSDPSTSLVNGVLPWASVRNSVTTGFASVAGGRVVPLSGAIISGVGLMVDGTANYDAIFTSSTQTLTSAAVGNTLRNRGLSRTINLGANSLTLNGLMASAGDFTIQSASTGTVNIGSTSELALHLGGSNLIINAPIVNSGAGASSILVQSNGPGLLVLGGASTYSGGTFLNGGTTALTTSSTGAGGAVTRGPLGTGTVTFGGGALMASGPAGGTVTIGNNIAFLRNTVVALGDSALNFTGTTTLQGGTRTFVNSSILPTIFSGPIVDGAGADGLTLGLGGGGLGGPIGRVIFAGANTYAGLTVVEDAILQVGNGGPTGSVGSGAVVLNQSESVLSFNRADDFQFTNEIRGIGKVRLESGSTLKLVNGFNSVGSLEIGSGASGGTIDVGALGIALNGGGVQASASGTIAATGGGKITLDRNSLFGAQVTLGASAGKTLAVSAIIQDGTSNGLQVANAPTGIVSLSGANTYTGPTRVTDGTLSASSLNSVGAGRAASSSLGAPSSADNGIIVLGSDTSLSARLRYTGAGQVTDRGITVEGLGETAATIEHAGSGVLNFAGFVPANENDPPIPGVLFTASNAQKTLVLTGSTTGVGEISGPIVDLNVNPNGGSAILKSGSGTWRLSGSNAYGGPTILRGGTLVAAASPANVDGTPINAFSYLIMAGAKFQFESTGSRSLTLGGTLRNMELLNGANAVEVSATDAGSVTLDLSGVGGNLGIQRSVNVGAGVLPKNGTVDFRTSGGAPLNTTTRVIKTAQFNDLVIPQPGNPTAPNNGILGPWATVNRGAALATNDDQDPNDGSTKGNIVAFTNYFNRATPSSGLIAINSGSQHFRFQPGASGVYQIGNGSLPIATKTITTNVNMPITLDLGGSLLRLGAIPRTAAQGAVGAFFITPTADSLTVGTTGPLALPGQVTGANNGTTLGEIILANFSLKPDVTMTINSDIIDNPVINATTIGFIRVTKTGPGTATIAGMANAYTGALSLFEGKLNLNHETAIGANRVPPVNNQEFNIVGGTLDNTSGAPITFNVSRLANWFGDFTIAGTNAMTFGPAMPVNILTPDTNTTLGQASFDKQRIVTINGQGLTLMSTISSADETQFVKAGTGPLTLNGPANNLFRGGLWVKGGSVVAANASTTFGTGEIILGDAAGSNNVTLVVNDRTYDNQITAAAGNTGSIEIRTVADANTVLAGGLVLNHDLGIASVGSGVFEIAGPVTGAGALVLGSGNQITLNGENSSFRGFVSVTSGRVLLGRDSALGDSVQGTAIASGASIELDGHTLNEPMFVAGTGSAGAGALINSNTTTAAVKHGSVTLTGGASIGGNGDLLLDGPIGSTGAFNFVKIGTGTTVLGGVSTLSGPTSINAGTLQYAKRVALYNGDPSAWTAQRISVAPGATAALNVGGAGEFTAADLNTLLSIGDSTGGGFQSGSAVGLDTTNAAGGNFIYGGSISDPNAGLNSRGLTKLGAGTLTLAAANSYTGPTVIRGGTLLASAPGSLPAGSAVSLPVPGVTLDLNNAAQTIASLSGAAQTTVAIGTGALTVGDASNTTFAGTITGGGNPVSLVKQGSGALTLAGPSSYAGGTLITNGTIVLGNANGLGNTAASTSIQAGATLDLNGQTVAEVLVLEGGSVINGSATPAVAQGAIEVRTNSMFGGPGSLTLAAELTGGGDFQKIGPGTAILNVANANYAGAIVVANGTLRIGDAASLGGVTAGTTVAAGGALDLNGQTIAEPLTLAGAGPSGAGALVNSSVVPAAATDSVTLAGHTSIGGANALAVQGPITGGFGLTKVGTGTTTLSGVNDYTGRTTVAAGTLQLTKLASLYNGQTASFNEANLLVAGGSTLRLNVGGPDEFDTAALNALLPLGSASGGFQNGSVIALDTTNAGGNFAYGGPIVDPNGGANLLGLSKVGTGTLTLSGANSYSGPTRVIEGTLAASIAGAFSRNSAHTLSAGTTLALNGTAQTIRSLTGTASNTTVSLGAGALTVGDTANTVFAGTISGTSSGNSLVKQGTGALTLTGQSSYSGATVVNRGTLVLDAQLTSATDNNPILNPASKLVMGGGTLRLIGSSIVSADNTSEQSVRTQTVRGLDVTGGANVLEVNNPTGAFQTTLNLRGPGTSLIARTGGTIDFRPTTGTFTSTSAARIQTVQQNLNGTNNGSQIIGAWATVHGGADLATNIGDLILPFTAYTGVTLGTPVSTTTSQNQNLRITGGTGNMTFSTPSGLYHTLQQNIGTAANVDVVAGGTIRFGSATPTVPPNAPAVGAIYIAPTRAALTVGLAPGTGNVTAGSATNGVGELILGNFSTGGALTVNSNIINNGTGAVSVTKSGTGTVVLASTTNTYTGATNIDAGTVVVTGSISASSLTRVRGGATLAGTGSVGALTIEADGRLAPGIVGTNSGFGNLTTGNLILAANAIFDVDIGDTTAGLFDAVLVTGSVTLGDEATGRPTLLATKFGGFSPTVGSSFTIIDNDGADAVDGTFREGSRVVRNGVTFDIRYDGGIGGNDVTLTVAAIPEPGTAGLLLGAAAPLLGLRRFRRRS
jgi:fibronectin-binding autotransporter adhesin